MTDNIAQMQLKILKIKEEIRVKKEFELYTRSLLDKHIKKHILKMIDKIEENEYEN